MTAIGRPSAPDSVVGHAQVAEPVAPLRDIENACAARDRQPILASMTRIKTITITLIAAAALIAVSAVPASAATYNESHALLKFPARGGTFTVTRTLPLRGWYLWAGVTANLRRPHPLDPRFERRVKLIGRYRIIDTLKPAGQIYVHNAQIINLRTGGKVNLPAQPANEGNGMYIYGSLIAHL
jgi:hypothetical protein